MLVEQDFDRECRAEVSVLRSDKIEGVLADSKRQTMVRGLASTLVNQGSSTTEPDQKAVDLPYTNRQHDGRRGNGPSARKNLCQNFHASYVAFAHQHPSQSRPPPRRRYC
jgi:hypothetical protein